jgi:hypothetical protein
MAENFFATKEDAKVRSEFDGSSGKTGMKKPKAGTTMDPKPEQLFGNEGKKGK